MDPGQLVADDVYYKSADEVAGGVSCGAATEGAVLSVLHR
jgi:hypothetical protein